MKLTTEFVKLPIRFDVERLQREAMQFNESDWFPHPQGYAGNSAIPLISVQGRSGCDKVGGPMSPTEELGRCPYIKQALAALRSPLGRTRFMRIEGNGEATAHVDTNYYWMQRVRVHIPIVTHPSVVFQCGDQAVHMAAGECWIFDTWRMHNVLNNHCESRIHLVVDTVGSPYFWSLVEQASEKVIKVHQFDANVSDPSLECEAVNMPVVMTPWEVECTFAGIMEDIDAKSTGEDEIAEFEFDLRLFLREWRSLWARFGESEAGEGCYRAALNMLQTRLSKSAGKMRLINGVRAEDAVLQGVVRVACNSELRKSPAGVSAVALPAQPKVTPNSSPRNVSVRGDQLMAPTFIIAAPRSGSTLLFETLSQAHGVFTIGGESHDIFESIAGWSPAEKNWESNRLDASDATPAKVQELRQRFLERLKDRDGNSAVSLRSSIRMLEKTPKNALRIPLLTAAFSDAKFIYLYRDPKENISSIMEAWRSGKFVTYPNLPDWNGLPWSLLLVPGWRDLAGKPLEEIAAAQWSTTHRIIMGDLGQLPPDRWLTVTYEEFLSDPQTHATRISHFAGWRWDKKITGSLPNSKHTLTPPAPDKWKNNAAEIERVLPGVNDIAQAFLKFSKEAKVNPPPAIQTRVNSLNTLRSVHSSTLSDLLKQAKCSLLVSTYQAGKLVVVRSDGNSINTHFCGFASPMGIAGQGNKLALGTLHQVYEFTNQPESAARIESEKKPDAVFLPRSTHYTGDIRIHEIAYADDDLWIVNTRFSCLCTLDDQHSFVPRWRPNFITSLAPEDRCHLNGLAVIDDKPKFVTALGVTDTQGGWRVNKRDGGVLIDVESDEVVVRGLSMPHSPRWYDGKLWILESGYGSLSIIDLKSGKKETVVELPGFTRGIDFLGSYAFIGLSQVRESAVFSGLPITEPGRQRECGVHVVDLRAGRSVGFLRFEDGVQEIFAVHALGQTRWPEVVVDNKEMLSNSFVLPKDALLDVPLFKKVA